MTKAHLSSALRVGDLLLRNRNVMASLTRNRAIPTNIPGKHMTEYYVQRARGGAGLILAEGTLVVQQGTEWPNAPGIWSDEQVAAWKDVTDGVHAANGLIFSQLWHVGRLAHPDMPEHKASGKPVYGPSAIAAAGGKFRILPGQPGYVMPAQIEDPRTIVEEFRHAAKQAKKAGFDGIDLHGSNGYLIHQFLDSGANQRTDSWGGSVENRARFALEVTKAVCDVWGPARVGIKFSPAGGYNDVGMPLPETVETFSYVIQHLIDMHIAYVQFERSRDSNPTRTPHNIFTTYGHLFKQAKPDPSVNPSPTRLFINGGLTPAEANALVADGSADAAVFGQLWMSNPDLQNRIESGLDVGGKGINERVDWRTSATFPPEKGPNAGYTDYPFAT